MATMDSREVVKRELARIISAKLVELEMNQSDLARAAALPREAISTYIRGRSMPSPVSLKKIAKALGFKSTEDMLPDVLGLQVQDENPALDMRSVAGHPGRMWVRINQSLPIETATKILQLINEATAKDAASD